MCVAKCQNKLFFLFDQAFEGFAQKFQPIGTPVPVEEVAKNILFLASDDVRMITGINHVIDGGLLLAGAQPDH